MSETTLGKKFEEKFKTDWKKQFPDSLILRLPDNMNGFKEASRNPCDFIAYKNGRLFMVECKEHEGKSIPFTAIPQYERLLEYKGLTGVFPGALIWFSECDKVIWVSIDEMEKMVNNGEKSIGLRFFKDKLYNIIEIPSVKKRVFMDSDYSILLEDLK